MKKNAKSNHKLKKIAAITGARNDEFFLSRWVEYYGAQLGKENIYLVLDGLEQKPPKNAGNANVEILPHFDLSRIGGDMLRADRLSTLANRLLTECGYDIVICGDSDEIIVADPAIKKSLREYLSEIDVSRPVSALGLDVGQHLTVEKKLDRSKPFLQQRGYALLSTRYTKSVIIAQPVTWGQGFHRVKGRNFRIDKNLYLFHFGGVDLELLKDKAKQGRDPCWEKHLWRRGGGVIKLVSNLRPRDEKFIRIARTIQTFARPPYAWNKPFMFGLKWVVRIPTRFKDVV